MRQTHTHPFTRGYRSWPSRVICCPSLIEAHLCYWGAIAGSLFVLVSQTLLRNFEVMAKEGTAYLPLNNSVLLEEGGETEDIKNIHLPVCRKPLGMCLSTWATVAIWAAFVLSNMLWIHYWLFDEVDNDVEYYRMAVFPSPIEILIN
jgi:hypothetical protein